MDDIELFKEFHVYGKRNIDHELLAYLSMIMIWIEWIVAKIPSSISIIK